MSNIVKMPPSWTVGGKTFFTLPEARAAEVEINAIAQLRELLKGSINSGMTRTGNIDNVLKEMLLEESALRNILLGYNKRQPRQQKVG